MAISETNKIWRIGRASLLWTREKLIKYCEVRVEVGGAPTSDSRLKISLAQQQIWLVFPLSLTLYVRFTVETNDIPYTYIIQWRKSGNSNRWRLRNRANARSDRILCY